MKFTPDQIQLLVANKIIPKNTPSAQVEFFLEVCGRKRLDPFQKQIHMVERNEKNNDGSYSKSYTIQASIDGMRAIAQRNVKVLKYERGVITKNNYDITAMKEKLKLYGFCRVITADRGEYYDELCFDEYVQRTKQGEKNHFWKQFPETMIKKCAEESVLRMVAPEDLSEIYGDDEMGDEPVISAVETTATIVVSEIKAPVAEPKQIQTQVQVLPDQNKEAQKMFTPESSMEVLQEANKSDGTIKIPMVTAPVVEINGKQVHSGASVSIDPPLKPKGGSGVLDKTKNENKYVPEDVFKIDFRKCKTFKQYLELWNRLSPNQRQNKEWEFLKKMIQVAGTVDELAKLQLGCSHELKVKYADDFAGRRNFLEGKVQENMFEQQAEQKLMEEIDQLKTKKQLKEFAKKNLKEIQKLEPSSYKRVSERLENLEQKLVDY